VKVAIIGGKGQLGSDLVHTCPGEIDMIAPAREDLDITITDQVQGIISRLKPEIIINTAAYHKPEEDNAEIFYKINAIAVRDLANIARTFNVTIVHVSTDYVFDGKLPWESAYDETALTNPLNTYGVSKVAPLKVINDIRMSPTYTLDAARGIWKLITGKYPFGIYHMANAGACTWYDFARMITEYCGHPCDVHPVSHAAYPSKIIRPMNSALKNTRGPVMRSWQEAIQDYLTT
jgi:dTDP-4-dehydrorhamnose reductase